MIQFSSLQISMKHNWLKKRILYFHNCWEYWLYSESENISMSLFNHPLTVNKLLKDDENIIGRWKANLKVETIRLSLYFNLKNLKMKKKRITGV